MDLPYKLSVEFEFKKEMLNCFSRIRNSKFEYLNPRLYKKRLIFVVEFRKTIKNIKNIGTANRFFFIKLDLF